MDLLSKFSFCGAIALLLTACASGPPSQPPNSALADAQAAINQAEQANAGRYAPLALDSARNKLTEAKKVLGPDRDNEDHFDDARRLAEEAAADAQLATARAHAKQAKMHAEAVREKASGTTGEPAPGLTAEPLAPPAGGAK